MKDLYLVSILIAFMAILIYTLSGFTTKILASFESKILASETKILASLEIGLSGVRDLLRDDGHCLSGIR